MYVATGFADKPDGWNYDWTQLSALVASGWSIQLTAGPNGGSQLPGCTSYYACRIGSETAAAYQARVAADIAAGQHALISRGLLSAPSVTFATPYDDWGQASGDSAVTSFLPGYLASQFAIVFHESWGYVPGFNRRFRFDVLSTTTAGDFISGLSNALFLL